MNEWQEQGPWIPRNICLTCARSSLWQLWGYTNKCWNEAWLIDHRGRCRMFTDYNEAPDNKWLRVSLEGQINGKSCDSKPWLAALSSPTRTNQAVGHLNRSLQSTFQMSSKNVMQSREREIQPGGSWKQATDVSILVAEEANWLISPHWYLVLWVLSLHHPSDLCHECMSVC